VSFVTPAYGATRSELEAHQKKAADARKRAAAADSLAKKLADEVADLDKRIDDLKKQADALAPDIAKATKRSAALQREVAQLKAEAAAAQAEIERTQLELDTQKALLAARVESSYKQGSWFYLDVLLGSSDFRELITRTELVTRVIESNNNVAADLGRTKESLDKSKAKLDRSLQTASLKKKEAEAVESQLRGLRAQRQSAANSSAAVQKQKADLMASSRKNAARLRALAEEEEAESRRLAAELAGSGSGRFAGTMSWPVPGYTRVTSPFGWRTHPIFGDRRFHTGIDIGRKADGTSINGAKIVAAGSGTVISAGYRGGYGNTVIVDHGDGVTTLYAHIKSGGINVSSGQSVARGQHIAAVGSTGNSTAPHLHFEVRVNGTPKNPMAYF
jgi:murein DD-endopeptidase MepM/ murein hydrolase activator NlpD